MIHDLQQTDDPRDLVHRCVQVLVEGGIVGVPSETVYGIVASSLRPDAVERLAEMVRSAGGGTIRYGSLALSLRSHESVEDYILHDARLVQRLSRRCLPGPLTMVARCDHEDSAVSMLPPDVADQLRTAAEQDDDEASPLPRYPMVGLRVSGHRILTHIHRYLSAPIVWGELAGVEGPVLNAAALAERTAMILGEELPMLLDDGPSRYGRPGTVVRIADNTWKMIREGVIQRAAMSQFVKPVIAVVCTGNTCRSPMAETILRDILHKKLGREDAVRVISAGVAAGRGSGASPQAVEVMGRLGLDLTGHSSQPVDDPLMAMADLVLTMTRRHRDAILAAWPNRADRVFTLRKDGGDVSDPVGMPVEIYQQCADQIRQELDKWVDSLDHDFFPSESDAGEENRHNTSGDV